MLPLAPSGFHIVLYEPEIPANTGNIGRLCVGSGSRLHIVLPCRFLLTDKAVKRAGLDYWDLLNLTVHKSLDDVLAGLSPQRVFFCTTKAERNFWDITYQPGDAFVFGPESRGLPDSVLDERPGQLITIPMHPDIRSLNLSNSVSIILFEALRQINHCKGKNHVTE